MADVITRFKLETTQFDSKLRDAAKTLQDIARTAQSGGKNFNDFSKKSIEAARALGTVQSGATNTKDKLKDLVGSFNDAAKAYNSLNETAKKGEFGKALEASLQKLQQDIKQTKEELYGLGDAVKSKSGGLFGNLGDKMGGAMQVFAGNVMTKIAGMGVELAGEMGEMITQGIELAKQGEGIRIAFERLGRGDILDGLRKATHGTVTDLELMKAAVKFNDFKLPLDELATMLSFAQQKAKDTGQSVDYLVESIVNGLGRQSTQILDNLGLSQSEVKRRTAEVGDMTKAVGEIIREQMSAAGDYVETAADRAAQAHVSLQNKMEELGRKFSPLSEASNNFWTSMKIGILDIVGGPLTDLLNKLTQVGRMMNAYGQMGGSGKVGRLISNLSGAREGNRQSIYQQQLQQFWRYINPREQQLKDIRAWQSGERGEALQGRINAIRDKYGSLDATKIQAEIDAAKKMLSDYKQAANTILSPVKVDINTNEASTNLDSLKKKLKELKAQRKKAIQAGDTDLSKSLSKQINQVKADIRGLDPSALKTGGGGKGGGGGSTTKQERAQAKLDRAQNDYNQVIELATLELKAGTIKEADYNKKKFAAQESLWKAIGDAREIYDSPQLKDAQDKAAAEIVRLGGEVTANIEAQKRMQESAKRVEQAQKRLADAQQRLAEARESGSATAIYKAQQNVNKEAKATERTKFEESVKNGTITELPNGLKIEVVVDVDDSDAIKKISDIQNLNFDPATLTVVTNDAQALADLQEINGVKLDTKTIKVKTDNETSGLESLKRSIRDELEIEHIKIDDTTLHSILKDAIQKNINGMDLQLSGLSDQIAKGIDIPDKQWESILDQYNKLRAQIGEKPIEVNLKTGQLAKDGEAATESWKKASSAINSASGALSSIENPAAKIMGTIGQAIATIALAYAETLAKDKNSKRNIWAFIATAAAAMISMATTISSIHSSTGYASGGIVDGRAGGFVGGTAYSGDNVGNVRLSSGELVLNRSQQNNLANALEGGMKQIRIVGQLKGEDIVLMADRYGRRSGLGELAFWK